MPWCDTGGRGWHEILDGVFPKGYEANNVQRKSTKMV